MAPHVWARITLIWRHIDPASRSRSISSARSGFFIAGAGGFLLPRKFRGGKWDFEMITNISKPQPNFSAIPPELIGMAWEAWEAGDIFGIMCLAGHADRGQLVMDNISPFCERGLYEAALFQAYTHGPHLHPDMWRFLFSFADRERLLKTGDSIPVEPLTVYRGVSCASHRRWIRGMSWTTNKNTAAWFALRWQREGQAPAVYSLYIKPEDVFFMTNERSEAEAVVAAWQCGRVKRLEPMPEAINPGNEAGLVCAQ